MDSEQGSLVNFRHVRTTLKGILPEKVRTRLDKKGPDEAFSEAYGRVMKCIGS